MRINAQIEKREREKRMNVCLFEVWFFQKKKTDAIAGWINLRTTMKCWKRLFGADYEHFGITESLLLLFSLCFWWIAVCTSAPINATFWCRQLNSARLLLLHLVWLVAITQVDRFSYATLFEFFALVYRYIELIYLCSLLYRSLWRIAFNKYSNLHEAAKRPQSMKISTAIFMRPFAYFCVPSSFQHFRNVHGSLCHTDTNK